MVNPRVKALKVSVICGLGGALIFAAFSLVFYFGEWARLALVFVMGLFIGLIAAPELEPKAFKMAWLYQLGSGVVAGLLVGLAFNLGAETIMLTTLLGGLLGWSAPFWVKHVPIP